jgi:hypothetical protein
MTPVLPSRVLSFEPDLVRAESLRYSVLDPALNDPAQHQATQANAHDQENDAHRTASRCYACSPLDQPQ